MTHEQFRQRLLVLRSELLAQAQDAAASTKPVVLDQSSVGRLSRMDAIQGQHMALESARRREQKLAAIDGALRRLDSGDFGLCYACGAEIPESRLKVDPTLTRCVACAQVTP